MAMKPYHSVQISIPPLGEILFQAITLHQGDVILTLCRYCPPQPVSSAVPLRQWHVMMYKMLNPSHVATKDISAVIKILKWLLHRNFIIILGVRCIRHNSLDEMIIC